MYFSGAGADTTSIGMRTCLFYICQHPEVYQALQKDIDLFYGEHDLSQPITYAQTQKIPYLVAVVKEAMRLLPSIVYQLLRHCPEGQTVDGKTIPPGTVVGVSPIAQNRDRAIWGAEADDFRPQRWLESKERSAYLDLNNYTFGGNGPRMCIGRNLALVSPIHFCTV
jgi:cytochrome P450